MERGICLLVPLDLLVELLRGLGVRALGTRDALILGQCSSVAKGSPKPRAAMNMLDLGNPSLSWVSLAQGMGVEAARATTLEQCADMLRASFRRPQPFLIELMV